MCHIVKMLTSIYPPILAFFRSDKNTHEYHCLRLASMLFTGIIGTTIFLYEPLRYFLCHQQVDLLWNLLCSRLSKHGSQQTQTDHYITYLFIGADQVQETEDLWAT